MTNPNNSLPVVPVFDISFQEQTGVATTNRVLRIGTHGRGIWEATISPTAAGVSVSGRVTSGDGRGLRNASVTITDPHGANRNMITSARGYFQFDDVESGQTYLIAVRSRRFQFEPRLINVTDNLTGIDFVATP